MTSGLASVASTLSPRGGSPNNLAGFGEAWEQPRPQHSATPNRWHKFSSNHPPPFGVRACFFSPTFDTASTRRSWPPARAQHLIPTLRTKCKQCYIIPPLPPALSPGGHRRNLCIWALRLRAARPPSWPGGTTPPSARAYTPGATQDHLGPTHSRAAQAEDQAVDDRLQVPRLRLLAIVTATPHAARPPWHTRLEVHGTPIASNSAPRPSTAKRRRREQGPKPSKGMAPERRTTQQNAPMSRNTRRTMPEYSAGGAGGLRRLNKSSNNTRGSIVGGLFVHKQTNSTQSDRL